MITYIRLTFFVILLLIQPVYGSYAIDFDQDGYADFVLVSINEESELEWFALDVNDSSKRSLGQFGQLGNHLAVGNWSGNGTSSKAVVSRKVNGEFEWSIDLSAGNKKLVFGSSPAKVVSGLDTDGNSSIDPAVVSSASKTLNWKVMSNPALVNSPVLNEFNFGSNRAVPFYANLDGSGDQIATASVAKNGVLNIRYKNLKSGRVKTNKVSNFKSTLSAILPVAQANGKDAIFAISKQGSRINVSIINAKQRVKRVQVDGDEIVVGQYLGDKSEVLVVRNDASKSTFIDSKGGKTILAINLDGILVDEININSFSETQVPEEKIPEESPPVKNRPNPICSGVADSREHLLYKPSSDTSGNAVLVFDSIYSSEFRAVRIELKDGSFAEAWWKGLELWGNPDSYGPRQHWRTNVRAGLVKDNALIVVDDTSQECRFVLPGSSGKRWE